MPQDRLPCPCCGHRTLTALDEYELCPVCFWEDDPRQSSDPYLVDGANGKSLAESRRTYARIGAMDEIFLAKVRPVRSSEAGDEAASSQGRLVRDERRTSAEFPRTAVVASAITVGVVAAVPVALLVVLGPAFAQALVDGASLGQAWDATAPTSDDWEVLPAFLVGAVFLSLPTSLATAATWLLIRRSRTSALLAHAGAAVAAAGVPLLLLAFVNPSLAVSVAVPAALVTLVAAPLVARARRQPARTVTRTSPTPAEQTGDRG